MALSFPAIACLLAITLSYLLLCAVSPFGNCRKCRGFGFRMKQNRKGQLRRGRDCRRCHGYGKRIRTGRRLLNLVYRLYRERSN